MSVGVDELRAQLKAKNDELDLAAVRLESFQMEINSEKMLVNKLADQLSRAYTRIADKDGDIVFLNMKMSKSLGLLNMVRGILEDDCLCIKAMGLDARHIEDAIEQIDKLFSNK